MAVGDQDHLARLRDSHADQSGGFKSRGRARLKRLTHPQLTRIIDTVQPKVLAVDELREGRVELIRKLFSQVRSFGIGLMALGVSGGVNDFVVRLDLMIYSE